MLRSDECEVTGNVASEIDITEDALALDFTQRFRSDWKYIAAWGYWLTWTGERWQRENTLRAYDLAREVCRQGATRADRPHVKTRLSCASTVSAVERLARADRGNAESADVWDRDPWLLNTRNGIVDLRYGKLSGHDRRYCMTKIAAASPNGECPTWINFLATVTGGDRDLQEYLRRVVGYCLTGVTMEHALFFLYGTGANGKSVFLNTVATILGEYVTSAPAEMFMSTQNDRHPTDMAGLRGARLVTATETDQGRRWAESRIKALTGGDKISARFMRQDFFEFEPQFKLVIAGNHKPGIRNIDEAMRRRLHLIPFLVTIPPEHRDKNLTERLLAERDGILAWAVRGCLEWQTVGLSPPAAVLSATEDYFADQDSIGRWIAEECLQGAKHTELFSALYDAWKRWAEDIGEYVLSKRAFSQALGSRGYEKWRDGATTQRGFRGLALRSGSQSTDEMEL